jgi:hypothetical protein
MTPRTSGVTPRRMDEMAGASIRLWRAPNRIWPWFPTLIVARAASRLGRVRAQPRSPALGKGGVVSVVLDGSRVGDISPQQIKVFQVSAGEHLLSVQFLGGLRRSRKYSIPLAAREEKQRVCWLNAVGWPSIRLATPSDVAAMQRPRSPAVDGSDPA